MASDPSLQRLEQALKALSNTAAQPFMAWVIDRYGLRLADRLGCEWPVHDAMTVIRQRLIGVEPDLEPYRQLWGERIAETPLTFQQLKLGRACAGALCNNPRSVGMDMAEAYTVNGLDAAPLIRAMLEKLC